MLTRRYELKFVVTASQKDHFLRAAREGLEGDPHGTDARYCVSSLYFDTACLKAYWDKLDGVAIRKKYRLRRYAVLEGSDLCWGAAFMEIKHRRNNTVYKERVPIDPAGLEVILRSPRELARLERHLARDVRSSPATVDAIVRAALKPGFGPTCVVSYRREAWLGSVDPRLRVTFDSFCCARRPEVRFSADIRQGHPLLSPTLFVMEVKFDHAIPTWIREITVAHALRPQRFSKYATAIDALELGVSMPAREPIQEPPEPAEPILMEDQLAPAPDRSDHCEELIGAGIRS